MSAKIFVAIENLRRENAALRARIETLEIAVAQMQAAAQRYQAELDEHVATQPLPITGASVESSPVDIRIELRRAGTTITISWPVTAAGACSTWLRDLLS